jgi:hypothetical protein
MLFTVLILLAMALILSVVLWAGTIWFQGWLYSEPADELYWRAPAVGVGLTLFLALWVIVDCRNGGRVRPLHQTSVYQSKQFDEFKAVVRKNGPEETFKRVPNADNRQDFRVDGRRDGNKLPAQPEKIIITENGAADVFEPQRNANGTFHIEPGLNLQYYDKYGRVMTAGELGAVSQFRYDWFFLDLFFNAAHLGLWFAGLWLVLRYQWAHALGFAFTLWLTMTLFPIPMILDYAQQTFHVV